MIIHDVQQNSEEWEKLREAKFTGSLATDLLMDKKNKGYINLIKKVFEEKYTGEPCESKAWQGNSFTDRGHILEPFALQEYSNENFCDLERVGFVELNPWTGCSPDSFVGKHALVQVKCPIFDTQLGYLADPEVPTNYYKQMQFELYVCGREWNDFYSWHPKLPSVQIRVERDEIMIKQIETRLAEAIKEVESRIKQLKRN